MKRLIWCSVFILFFLACPAVFADPIRPIITGPAGPTSDTTLTLKSADFSKASYGGYVLSPYTLTLTNSSGTTDLSLWCIDFNHQINLGDSWGVTITDVSGDQYFQQLVWIIGAASQELAQWTIWYGGAAGGAADRILASYPNFQDSVHHLWAASAGKQVTNITITDYKPTGYPGQEFISFGPRVKTPEPASILLLGIGILTVSLAYSRKRRCRKA